MKNLVYILAFLIAIISCTSSKTAQNNNEKSVKKETAGVQKKDTIRIANDSLEYEVIIFEVGFNSWLASRARPRGYYSVNYLENKNRYYVYEYNYRVNLPQQFRPELYPMRIDYDTNIHYGYEVNYLLYNYFIFFQEKYNQNLSPGGLPVRY